MADEEHDTGQLISVGILFGDIKGSTAEAEADEQGTVAKLREYERVVNRLVKKFSPSHYKVRYEGDGFMAVFDTAKPMLECGVAIRDEFRKRQWLVRLGGHFGEAYRNDDGDILGADVNRAARIQSGAEAGDFLVSATVQQIVRNKSRDIGFRRHTPLSAKGISEPLEVFEVILAEEARQPRPKKQPVASPAPRRQHWPVGAALVIAGLLIAAAVYQRANSPSGNVRVPPKSEVVERSGSQGDSPIVEQVVEPEADRNVVAVLTFENLRLDEENSWFSKALQTTLTTELNKIDQLHVVSLEMIQRVEQREDLDRMAAARRLGVQRFVAGSFAVYGDEMRIDAWVVETADGLQSAASTVEGMAKEFFKLQKAIARTTLDHLQLQLTQAEETTVKTAKMSNVDKYRQLLGAEGVLDGSVRVRKQKPSAHGSNTLRNFISRYGSWRGMELVGSAYAETTPYASTSEVLQFLEAYRSAHEAGDIERLSSLYVSLPESQKASVKAYMSNIEELSVELDDVEIEIGADEVAVSYTRVDSFVDVESGEGLALEVRLTKFLVRQDDGLKFAAETSADQ